MKILLVEDDNAVGDFIVAELDAAGHQCQHEVDGEQGFRAARDGNWDVLVIDRMLPRLDGLGLLQKLREAFLRILQSPHPAICHRLPG